MLKNITNNTIVINQPSSQLSSQPQATKLAAKTPCSNPAKRRPMVRGALLVMSAMLTVFSAQAALAGSTVVTDAANTPVLWTFEENLGQQNLTSKINQLDGKGFTQTFDASNNRTSRTDAEGRVTNYAYNATNQRLSMTEAVGTPQQRVTTYAYVNADTDLMTRMTVPSVNAGLLKQTINVYDSDLNITSTTVTGFAVDGSSVSRGTSFAYNSRGQVLTIDGPRVDVNDVTTFAYYDCSNAGQCGQLRSVTNALGHVTNYDRYDANSRLLQSTDANGIVTTNVYHPRGWLLSRTQTAPDGEARTTAFAYDNAGQMIASTAADGIVLSYIYDAAHDLRSITDNLGNRIEYRYDSRGNRNIEKIYDPDNTLVRSVERVYDMRNFIESINQAGSLTALINDAVGNVATQTDPNQNPSDNNTYDALDRLQHTVDALSNSSHYTYNVADQLIQVAAPNGSVTAYVYDDLDNLLSENSADRGLITYAHDAAGNVIAQTDARGITTQYTYDALNRLTDVAFPDSAEDIRYGYDSCPILGIGRLCTVDHEAGSEALAYDSWGNVIMQVREERGQGLTQAVSATTRYAYDAGDRITQITYPSARVVDYNRDVIGRLIGITSTAVGGTSTSLLSHRQYRADGLWLSQDYGNGLNNALNQSKQYDQQGRLLSHVAGDYTRQYQYDGNGNILDIAGSLNSLYVYDSLDRLIENTASDLGIDTGFAYDANGNRLQLVEGDNASSVLTYTANSNRLTQIDAESITLDQSGRTVLDASGRYYQYNDAGRLDALRQNDADGAVIARYHYNANQLRTRKTVNADTTLYHYDLAGNMLAESNEAGDFAYEYIYADGERIALFTEQQGVINYYINDHLGTPQRLLDQNGAIVWEASYQAFGLATINTAAVEQNHRFPGQYYDAESGLHYNWNRYYEPSMGRYVSSDPIGLLGGANTFGYVGGNPVGNIDPTGLFDPGNMPNPPSRTVGPPIAKICAIIGGAIVAAISGNSGSGKRKCDDGDGEQCDNKCPPCTPPAGEKFNKVTHWDSHSIIAGKGSHGCEQKTGSPVHWHYSVNRQNPKTCECFTANHLFGGCGPAPQ